jgi:CRP-like cAMP-binding protein
MQEQLLQLRQFIRALHPLPDKEWQAFSGIWQPFSAKRKEIITAAGEREKYLYFVLEGVQRIYYYDEQDREVKPRLFLPMLLLLVVCWMP